MTYSNINNKIERLCIIVNHGLGNKVVKLAKKIGILGSFTTYARGTVHNTVMDYIGLTDIRKEIVFILVERKNIERICSVLDSKFHFEKPNHGILFSTELSAYLGEKREKYDCDDNIVMNDFLVEDKVKMHNNHDMITVVVDKGKAEDVIEAAKKVGSRGGTIINARGSGFDAGCKVFAMEIEPEKEVVIIISKINETEKITNSIDKELNTKKANSGIIYVQELKRVYGIYEK